MHEKKNQYKVSLLNVGSFFVKRLTINGIVMYLFTYLIFFCENITKTTYNIAKMMTITTVSVINTMYT